MPSKCSICDSELNEFTVSKGHTNECRGCFAAYHRNNYRQPNEIIKRKARQIAERRLKIGILIKEPCQLCGKSKAEKHHPNYADPKNIVWLCKSCHTEMHILERSVITKILVD